MKSLTESIRENCFVITVFLVGLCVIGAIIYLRYIGSLMTSDTIQSILVTILVVTTVVYTRFTVIYTRSTESYTRSTESYARSTESYARSTHQSYQVALNAEKNAAMPVIALTAEITRHNMMLVSYQNVGKGPALNLRIWLELAEEKQFLYLKSDIMKNKGFCSAVGVDQSGYLGWSEAEGPLPTPTSGFDIVAEYDDVYQRHLASKLAIINQHDQEFSFGLKDQ